MAKILSFKNSKIRKNYNLRLVVNVSMEKDSNGTCRFGIDYNDEIVTEMELIKYLNNFSDPPIIFALEQYLINSYS